MKKTLTFMIVLSIILASVIGVYAEDNLTNKLSDGIKNIIDNNSATLKEVVGMIDEVIEYTIGKFSDIKESDWFTQTVSKLVGLGIIDGYPDGSFKPNESVNADAFIKMTVTALGYDDIKNGTDYWAMPYIEKAKDLGLVKYGEFESYNKPINRGQIARIIVRAMDESYGSDIDEYTSSIKDYNSISSDYRDYVLKAFAKGIITGYPDGTFKAENNSTRAEASTMLIRMLDETERKVPKKPEIAKKKTELTDEDIKRLQSYECYKLTADGKISGNYVSFEDMYAKERDDCEWIMNEFYPTKYDVLYFDKQKNKTVNEGKLYQEAKVNWLSSPKLVYETPISTFGVRGIIQIKYSSENNPYELKANTWYEVDVEYLYNTSVDGYSIYRYNRPTEFLSDFKEVK